MNNVEALVPSINGLLDRVEDQKRRIDVMTQAIQVDLTRLREKISISRLDANSVSRSRMRSDVNVASDIHVHVLQEKITITI